MNWLVDLILNPFLSTAISSWLIAQLLKLVIHTAVNREFAIERLFGDGGMPSGHSATVVSLATMAALTYGLASFEFAATFVLATIVCHDAMGVRLETGKQAVLINEIIESFDLLASEKQPEVKLKELVGHTPLQVVAGSILGIINAVIMYYWVF